MIQKDLVPILVNSMHNLEVFDAVIRLMVNLTVLVECLCFLEILTKSEDGRQTIYEVCLLKTKEVFVIHVLLKLLWKGLVDMQQMTRYHLWRSPWSTTASYSSETSSLTRLTKQEKYKIEASNQNQIMWNLFAQNLDKILLDLIKNNMRSIWCTSVVQLIALVYKD